MAYLETTATTINLPLGYIHEPAKIETRNRTLDGTMILNYAVTTGNVAVTKYHFEIPGITKSERLSIRALGLKTNSMVYVDNIQIPEVFSSSGSASTVTINLQRSLGSSDNISIYVNGTTQTWSMSTATNPSTGSVYITNSGRMTFGNCPASTNGIITYYIPAYSVQIISDGQEFLAKNQSAEKISRYRLVMEEV